MLIFAALVGGAAYAHWRFPRPLNAAVAQAPSTPFDNGASSARLLPPGAPATPSHPGAQPEQREACGGRSSSIPTAPTLSVSPCHHHHQVRPQKFKIDVTDFFAPHVSAAVQLARAC